MSEETAAANGLLEALAASEAHIRTLLTERAELLDALHAAERERNDLREELRVARHAADQAISNLRGIVALNDDPHIEEIARATADLLAGVLHENRK